MSVLTRLPAGLIATLPAPPTDRLEIGPLTFRLYGLMIALGVVAAVEIGRRRWAAKGGNPDDIAEIATRAVPAGLIGARAYHVLTDWTAYRGRWIEALYLWKGGLGIPGGLLAGVGVGIWYARRQGWNVTSLIDAVIPGIPVAQAIGRVGNWFNQEIYGRPTDVPWGLEVDGLDEPVHPTFLYEGLWNLAIAGSLIYADKRRWLKPGQMLPIWIVGYGVGRFLVEAMRTDAATELAGIRVNHWVSGAAVVLGLAWFLYLGRDRASERESAAADRDLDALDVEAE